MFETTIIGSSPTAKFLLRSLYLCIEMHVKAMCHQVCKFTDVDFHTWAAGQQYCRHLQQTCRAVKDALNFQGKQCEEITKASTLCTFTWMQAPLEIEELSSKQTCIGLPCEGTMNWEVLRNTGLAPFESHFGHGSNRFHRLCVARLSPSRRSQHFS